MSRRRIGQEAFGFAQEGKSSSTLDALSKVIDWKPADRRLAVISSSAKGEAAWPPVALFKALLLAVWYDLSDVKLAEALDDRSSFRRFCGFSRSEPTPERTAFVRFRKALIAQSLDKVLFDEITAQLKAKGLWCADWLVLEFRSLMVRTISMSTRSLGSERISGGLSQRFSWAAIIP